MACVFQTDAETGYHHCVSSTMPSISSRQSDLKTNALVAAAERGQLACLQQLLFDTDPDCQTVSGNSALRAATALGDAECICELLEHGANINLETCRGTALIAASTHGDLDTLLLLLDHGAFVDLETAVGTTALSAAIKQRRPAAVQLLLDRQADPQRPNCNGITPTALAQDMGDMHVLALLQQAQVQRAAQDALECLDKQSLQDEAAGEQLQVLALKEVQAEMAGKKQELCMKLAELQAHNAELRQRFQPSAQTA
ncbi:hypothetical protein ABBQ38_008097 [Trebouxia sp. C0009 RCD-2024]